MCRGLPVHLAPLAQTRLLALQLHVLQPLLLVLVLAVQRQLRPLLDCIVVHLLEPRRGSVAAEDNPGHLETDAPGPACQLLVHAQVVQLVRRGLELFKGLASHEFDDVARHRVDEVGCGVVRLAKHDIDVLEAVEKHDFDSHQGIVSSAHGLDVKVCLLGARAQLGKLHCALHLASVVVRIVGDAAVPVELMRPLRGVLGHVEARAAHHMASHAMALALALNALVAVDDENLVVGQVHRVMHLDVLVDSAVHVDRGGAWNDLRAAVHKLHPEVLSMRRGELRQLLHGHAPDTNDIGAAHCANLAACQADIPLLTLRNGHPAPHRHLGLGPLYREDNLTEVVEDSGDHGSQGKL
mmetsp:Transcript_61637/g.183650  ORF Transcript_61637/g.183650 Transcript_61637/m.183650 type:complete len:353 (+) Transcript_61637:626-1684(+)